jgi:hypothetical protein
MANISSKFYIGVFENNVLGPKNIKMKKLKHEMMNNNFYRKKKTTETA